MVEALLAFYKRWISPALHAASGLSGACRYHPSCSEYAAGVIERYGLFRGFGLAVWRLLRCNPFSHGGFDPVPGVFRAAASGASEPLRTGVGLGSSPDSLEISDSSRATAAAAETHLPLPCGRG